MTDIQTIRRGLRLQGELRCTVAWSPSIHLEAKPCTGYNRGMTGTLKTSDKIVGGFFFYLDDLSRGVHFRFPEWRGLHIPSIGIFRN